MSLNGETKPNDMYIDYIKLFVKSEKKEQVTHKTNKNVPYWQWKLELRKKNKGNKTLTDRQRAPHHQCVYQLNVLGDWD